MLIVVIQPISVPIGHWLNPVVRSGTDAYSIWQRYLSKPVPDVLVIGASLAQTDIDEAGLSAELSKSAGRTVTAEKMGFNGQGPLFYDALVYRIMKQPHRPKLMVITTAAPDLNAGCIVCLTMLTADLWDISDLTDPGFLQLALRVDPDPVRLAAGWVLPTLAYYPSVIALQCIAVNVARSSALAILGRVPGQLKNETVCETQPGYRLLEGWAHQPAITDNAVRVSTENYRLFMRNYEISPSAVSSLKGLVSRAVSGGVKVVLVETPLHSGSRNLFPDAQQAYQQQIRSLASSLNVDLLDLSESVPDDPTLWVDLLHLDRAGAAAFAPRLAGALAPTLGR